jgi:sugar porter (SP) family MFS transporter
MIILQQSINLMLPAFAKEFGQWNPDTQAYALPPYLSSIMTSMPFLGKLVATLLCSPFQERWGRKKAMLAVAGISLVGVLLQVTATTAAQFTLGRVVNFASCGFTISVVPLYESEIAPTALRGMFASTLQLWILIGNLISSVINNKTSTYVGKSAWLIPTGLQFILPFFIIGGYFFVPESPRWLLRKGRRDEATLSLKSLRGAGVPTESIERELALIEESDLQHKDQGTYSELFQGTNLKRTAIACAIMTFQQVTGQAFVSQYSTVFYIKEKIPRPFILAVIMASASVASNILSSLFVDRLGRRTLLLIGSVVMTTFLFVLGGLGTIAVPNDTQKSGIVACVMMFNVTFAMSWAPLSYVVIAEIPTARLREKTVSLSTSLSVIWTFIVSFTLPYLLNAPYANLGPKVGFIYGALSFLGVIWVIFGMPETSNRALEELDELFEKCVPYRKFATYRVSGVGANIASLDTANALGASHNKDALTSV